MHDALSDRQQTSSLVGERELSRPSLEQRRPHVPFELLNPAGYDRRRNMQFSRRRRKASTLDDFEKSSEIGHDVHFRLANTTA
jgi:hypothetical protein